MKKWDRIAAIFLCLLGVVAAWEATRIGFGSLSSPGPGFYPFWLAVILSICSLIYFLNHLGKEEQTAPFWQKGAWVRPLLAAGVMFGYCFLLKSLGFISATFLLFIAWLFGIEREKPLTVACVSVGVTVAVYLIFAVFLKVQLPKGLLF